MTKVVCIWGDSITWGRGLPTRVGWANLLRNYIESAARERVIELYDLGIDRNTTENVLVRFDVEAQARKPQGIIFAIGTNDSVYRKTKDHPEVPLDKFEKNICELITKARTYTSDIVFVGLAKGSDSETSPLTASTTGKSYDKENIRIYNEVIKMVCAKEKVVFVDITDSMQDEDYYDGLHPNADGHKKMFERIKDVLVANTII